MARFYLLIALLMAATSFMSLSSALPTGVPFNTMTHSFNPTNALLARNGTAVAFKNIWLNCNDAYLTQGRDADSYFCGKNAEILNRDLWIKPSMCPNLCKCDCNKQVKCKEWKQCDKNKVRRICIDGAPWSLGCFCDDGIMQPPTNMKATNISIPGGIGLNLTEHLPIPATPIPTNVIQCK